MSTPPPSDNPPKPRRGKRGGRGKKKSPSILDAAALSARPTDVAQEAHPAPSQGYRNAVLAAPAQDAPLNVEALNPSSLSTAPSLSRNPLEDELFEDDFCVGPVIGKPHFHLQHIGFSAIVEITYVSQSHAFREVIPFSVYSYYNWQLLHMRRQEINHYNGKDFSSDYLYESLWNNSYFADELVVKYLQGIGNVYINDEETVELAPIVSRYDSDGSLGPYTPSTASAYEQIACPAVLTDAMRAEFDNRSIWTPKDLRITKPHYCRSATPNANLPGYQKNPELTRNKRTTLASLGYDSRRDPVFITPFRYNHSICQLVSRHLETARATALFSASGSEGSIEQLCYLQHAELHTTDPRRRFVDGVMTINSERELTKQQMMHAFMMGYRFQEDENLGYTSFVSVTYLRHDGPGPLPPEYQELRNRRLFDRDHNWVINTGKYSSNPQSRTDILARYCSARSDQATT
jgi:hypothetical protein